MHLKLIVYVNDNEIEINNKYENLNLAKIKISLIEKE